MCSVYTSTHLLPQYTIAKMCHVPFGIWMSWLIVVLGVWRKYIFHNTRSGLFFVGVVFMEVVSAFTTMRWLNNLTAISCRIICSMYILLLAGSWWPRWCSIKTFDQFVINKTKNFCSNLVCWLSSCKIYESTTFYNVPGAYVVSICIYITFECNQILISMG